MNLNLLLFIEDGRASPFALKGEMKEDEDGWMDEEEGGRPKMEGWMKRPKLSAKGMEGGSAAEGFGQGGQLASSCRPEQGTSARAGGRLMAALEGAWVTWRVHG